MRLCWYHVAKTSGSRRVRSVQCGPLACRCGPCVPVCVVPDCVEVVHGHLCCFIPTHPGLDAELVGHARSSMSGSGEQHCMYVYLNHQRVAASPDTLPWASVVQLADEVNGMVDDEAVQCVSDVLSGKVLQSNNIAAQSLFVSELLTISLCDLRILDAARKRVLS
jgi:hypothetical protein